MVNKFWKSPKFSKVIEKLAWNGLWSCEYNLTSLEMYPIATSLSAFYPVI